MELSKYKKSILIFILFAGFFSLFAIASLFSSMGGGDLSPIIPGDNWGIDVFILLVVIIPLMAIIGAIVFGYLLSPLLLYVHKRFIGAKMEYGVQEIDRNPSFNKTFRGFFPALMAINLSLMFAFNPAIVKALVTPRPFAEVIAFSMLIIFTIIIAIGLFSAVWFLLDSGIVYNNKEKVNEKEEPTEVRSVGGYYLYLLKGYAGIGVIVALYSFFIAILPQTEGEGGLVTAIALTIFILPFPLMVAIACIPAVILSDITYDHRRKYLINWAKKFGIVDVLDIKIEKIEKS